MQPFQFITPLPPAAGPVPTPPSQLELEQLRAAADQATWTRYGVIVQGIVGAAAAISIYFTYRAAREATRQADAAWQQVEAQKSQQSAESMIAAAEFFTFFTDRFTLSVHYPLELPAQRIVQWMDEQRRNALGSSPAHRNFDELFAAGLRYSARISFPGCTTSWLALVDAARFAASAATRYEHATNSEVASHLEELQSLVRALRAAAEDMEFILETATRNPAGYRRVTTRHAGVPPLLTRLRHWLSTRRDGVS